MKTFILLIAVVFSSSVAMANGGKHMNGDTGPELIYSESGTIIGEVYTADEDCELMVSESGKQIIKLCDSGEED